MYCRYLLQAEYCILSFIFSKLFNLVRTYVHITHTHTKYPTINTIIIIDSQWCLILSNDAVQDIKMKIKIENVKMAYMVTCFFCMCVCIARVCVFYTYNNVKYVKHNRIIIICIITPTCSR